MRRLSLRGRTVRPVGDPGPRGRGHRGDRVRPAPDVLESVHLLPRVRGSCWFLRLRERLTRYEIAHLLRVPPSQVDLWETHGTAAVRCAQAADPGTVGDERLLRLAAALGSASDRHP